MTWRRNLVAITAAGFTGFMGFTLVMPFLPLYFRELGVDDVGELALWSGVSLGVTPAITALCAPFWGGLGDRFGRKIMVVRSLVSFIVVMTLLAFVTAPWQVLALRALQGLFAGYGALILTMTVESSPPERVARSIGLVQSTQRMAPAIGPVVGGAVAQLVGLRNAFLVSTLFYAAALAMIVGLYRERPRAEREAATARQPVMPVRDVMRFASFGPIMAVILGVQFVDRSFGPVLPLFLEQLGAPAAQVPLMAGAIFSGAALAGAGGHHLGARLLERVEPGRAIIGGAAVSVAAAAVLAAAPRPAWLFAATPLFGAGLGVAITAAYTAASRVIPAGVEGRAFGVLTSASLTGLALSPVINGLIGSFSIRAVFVVDALTLIGLALLVSRSRLVAVTRARSASCASDP